MKSTLTVMIAAVCFAAGTARALTEDRVLLLWNSQNAESTAVRNAYVLAHPGVLEFDFNASNLGPGALTRSQYNNRIKTPLLAFLGGTTGGEPTAQRVIAMATTRGMPARVDGAGEFTLASERASIESEIALIFQNLDGTGQADLPLRRDGIIDNPYHGLTNTPITTFSRAGITTVRTLGYTSLGGGDAVWASGDLTAGDFYLVCRLDAGAGQTTTALEETLALIERSNNPAQMTVPVTCVQALFDEYPPAEDQLDDDGIPPVFPAADDFDDAASLTNALGILTTHDETTNFITGSELASTLPLLVLGSYGENHDVGGSGEDPPGLGTYLTTYTPHPAGVAVTYESFSGNCLINGTQRQNQACATDWIAQGGSFIIPTVAEPFTFAIADLSFFIENFYIHGMSFAEAAYSATPGLSWANVPVGDPLATVTLTAGPVNPADLDDSGAVDGTDLAILIAAWGTSSGDVNGDTLTNASDLAVLLAAWGPAAGCP